jgi:hypothetical protein
VVLSAHEVVAATLVYQKRALAIDMLFYFEREASVT